MKTFIALSLFGIGSVSSQINNLYLISGTVNTNVATTPVTANTGFGTCMCDLTLNSCDVYCCCDTECSTAILNYWNANYNTYCTRGYIPNQY